MLFNNEYLHYTFIVIVTLLVAAVISKILRVIFDKFISKSSVSLNVDATNYNFLKNALNSIVYVIAIVIIFYSIPALKDLGLTLLASAGIFAAILGFASQQAFSNIVSGVFIVMFKPFRVGDQIKVKEDQGIIEDITLRHTIIRTFENRRFIIPNALISSETILNSTIADPNVCIFFEIRISYDSNVDKAIEIIREEAVKHANLIDRRSEEDKRANIHPVTVRMLGYDDSAIILRAYIWAADPIKGFVMKCDLYKSVKEKFDKEGIEIPHSYRTLVIKNKTKEALDD
ncbi:MAG: mechanosensitive ion channel [Ignavibacteriae bacterium]|nr:mechanosensitive ion channel family protein [Ignavibacteriota bacterium]NOG99191.1 mechanosensitive ion channel [Ignavibacteriota bacterium]